jgi:hypothetical protein
MAKARKGIIRARMRGSIRRGRRRAVAGLLWGRGCWFRHTFRRDAFMGKARLLIGKWGICMRGSFGVGRSMGMAGKQLPLMFIKVLLVMDVGKGLENCKPFLIRVKCKPN